MGGPSGLESLGIENDDYDGDDFDNDYDDDIDGGDWGFKLNNTQSTIEGRPRKSKKSKKIQIKRAIPKPEVKKEMRVKLFNMLSQARMDEMDLENELAELRAQEFVNEKKVDQVADM